MLIVQILLQVGVSVFIILGNETPHFIHNASAKSTEFSFMSPFQKLQPQNKRDDEIKKNRFLV